MTYTIADVGPRMVGGKEVQLTDAAKQAIADEWNATEAAKPMRDWIARMAASDRDLLTRAEEEIIAKIGTVGLSAELVAKYDAKLALRAQRPV